MYEPNPISQRIGTCCIAANARFLPATRIVYHDDIRIIQLY